MTTRLTPQAAFALAAALALGSTMAWAHGMGRSGGTPGHEGAGHGCGAMSQHGQASSEHADHARHGRERGPMAGMEHGGGHGTMRGMHPARPGDAPATPRPADAVKP
jgi:hypothetical protein